MIRLTAEAREQVEDHIETLHIMAGDAKERTEAAAFDMLLKLHDQVHQAATGAQAVILNGKIIISIDVDALPHIVSGACATNEILHGCWKVTDPAEFAKEVCHALNRESEVGTTPVHVMFDKAILHVIEQGGEGIDEVSEAEFEAEAARLQKEATP